jgi:hypothetical protein
MSPILWNACGMLLRATAIKGTCLLATKRLLSAREIADMPDDARRYRGRRRRLRIQVHVYSAESSFLPSPSLCALHATRLITKHASKHHGRSTHGAPVPLTIAIGDPGAWGRSRDVRNGTMIDVQSPQPNSRVAATPQRSGTCFAAPHSSHLNLLEQDPSNIQAIGSPA